MEPDPSNSIFPRLTAGESVATLGMKFLGANPSPKIEGVEQQAARSNYLTGTDPAAWRTNIPNYAKVRYAAVYPGIDLVFYGNRQELEYDFLMPAPAMEASFTRAWMAA
jgi:hypothetical protein